MPRVDPIEKDEARPEARPEWERQVAAHGRMTNMKRTLARSPAAFRVYMEWYGLRDEVKGFLGERLTLLFAHAISATRDCLICSTYFRRDLIASGEDPDVLKLSEKEMAFVDLAGQIARDPHGISKEMFDGVARHLEPDELVTLTAFAGLMVATNIVNDVLRVELDDYLEAYRSGGTP